MTSMTTMERTGMATGVAIPGYGQPVHGTMGYGTAPFTQPGQSNSISRTMPEPSLRISSFNDSRSALTRPIAEGVGTSSSRLWLIFSAILGPFYLRPSWRPPGSHRPCCFCRQSISRAFFTNANHPARAGRC